MTFEQLPANTIIHIPFQISTQKYGVLTSALNLSPAEAAAYTAADFTAAKQALREAWIAARDNQPAPVPLTDTELDEETDRLMENLEKWFRSLSLEKRQALKEALIERLT